MKKIITAFAFLLLVVNSIAKENTPLFPEQGGQRLIITNLHMTNEEFFRAYMSENIQERRLAEMYVVGVVNGSDGISWCGFRKVSPDAIQEQVFIALKKSVETSPKDRPSVAIVSHLKKILPCNSKK